MGLGRCVGAKSARLVWMGLTVPMDSRNSEDSCLDELACSLRVAIVRPDASAGPFLSTVSDPQI